MRDGELKLRIGQGVDMGRPSLLLTRVRKQNGAVASTHVGGSCVQMMEGTFRLPGEGVTCYTCFAAKFSILTPSRSSMISAIHCRWQWAWSRS